MQQAFKQFTCLLSIEYEVVRLSNVWYGELEVAYNGVTGAVCDGHWSTEDCTVACLQLGLG